MPNAYLGECLQVKAQALETVFSRIRRLVIVFLASEPDTTLTTFITHGLCVRILAFPAKCGQLIKQPFLHGAQTRLG